ncbi:T9SS type A sorting domain-containing protein [Pedobacter alpinus]|uniref:T9SS type A sorting domain-containing protein n=1 Tax=Pedobacter alpinus TaxID=1590643 RepID=UPI00361DC200
MSVQVMGAQPGSGSLELYNINGQKISSEKIVLSSTSTYNIAKPTQKGIYLIYLVSEGKKLFAGKISL